MPEYTRYTNSQVSKFKKSLAQTYPSIAKEWHRTKNGAVTPENVTARSGKNFWFKCKDGHEWQASLSNRTSNKAGCPYCAGQKLSKENCLKTKFLAIEEELEIVTKNLKIIKNDVKEGEYNQSYGHLVLIQVRTSLSLLKLLPSHKPISILIEKHLNLANELNAATPDFAQLANLLTGLEKILSVLNQSS